MNAQNVDMFQRVLDQAQNLPSMYGKIDFATPPERYVEDTDEGDLRADYAKFLSPQSKAPELVEKIRTYTMLGDRVADPYAALMREHGFRKLIDMLVQACDHGVESVEGAPPELVALIEDMARVPDWLDMDLVEQGVKIERRTIAIASPWAIRGGLIATFMNKYAALPMALTGTLSDKLAAKRVKETATFFSISTLPGALSRHGEGFKAAAMVRLMHSMVRANAIRSGKWDDSVYGIPIPQVDQMPAGLVGSGILSIKALRSGRNTFTPTERAKIEFDRYRCYLLGLPEDLLADTPQGIVDTMAARQMSLRKAYDDATCGELLRATMAAKLTTSDGFWARLTERFEKSFAKFFFAKNFLNGDYSKAQEYGVTVTGPDRMRALVVIVIILSQMKFYSLLSKVPGLAQWADNSLIKRIKNRLAGYGHAEFVTDATQYRAKHAG